MARTFSKEELSEVLRKHELWLNGEEGGERADLSGADLRKANLFRANLYEADLFRANLSGADLRGVNLSGADLFRANLYEADLSGAYLSEANLLGANLVKADLSGADLFRANLFKANLSEADFSETNLFCPIACPDTGSFIGWKKVPGPYIVKLLITEDAKRSSATGRKCRCDKAEVIAIENIDGTPNDVISVHSAYDADFEYQVGATVTIDDFDENRFNECAPGIHFFVNRQEAVEYII